ncbi:MAG: AMP-binding protein [Hormoscilla sp. GUM202]|nr:AMP-binding protein [Hormoscilla sp. GUM202]
MPKSSLPSQNYFPLSLQQERLWFLEQWNIDNPTQPFGGAFLLKGVLRVNILEQSIQDIIKKQDIFRTSFAPIENQPHQVVSDVLQWELAILDLQHLDVHERLPESLKLATQLIQQSFNIHQDPLWRIRLLRLEETRHILVLGMHPLICDGVWSIELLGRALGKLYNAFSGEDRSELPELGIQYGNWTVQQRKALTQNQFASQSAYWKKQLGSNLPILQLPLDFPRPTMQSDRGQCKSLKLSSNVREQLQRLSKQAGVSLFVVLLGVFKILLYRYTHQEDLLVGIPVSGRHRSGDEGIIGNVANTLVLRSDLSENPSFLTVLSHLQQVYDRALEHKDFPFPKLVEELLPERDPSLSPLFQVSFKFQENFPLSLKLPELTLSSLELENSVVSCDLAVVVQATETGLVWKWHYNQDLFAPATIDRLLVHFQTLLTSLLEHPKQPIEQVNLLTSLERHQLLVDWNETQVQSPSCCLHQLVETQVEKTPNVLAVVDKTQSLTYEELNHKANQLARYLRKVGVEPQDFVGICVERSPQMTIAILGVLKAGGVCVPLDPAYPQERLAYMLSDTGAQVLVTTETALQASSLHPIAQGFKLVRLDEDRPLIAQEPHSNPVCAIAPGHLAYIIYTSGSTGKPKGVMMAHEGLTNLIGWHRRERIVPARTLQFAPISFDISFHEMFSTWCSGGTLFLISTSQRRDPFALLQLIQEQQIEKLYLPFVALQQLAEVVKTTNTIPTTVKEVMTAGEQLQITPTLVYFFQQTGATLHNHYGASECQDVTTFTLTGNPEDWPVLPPIGRPLHNLQVYILDEGLQPLPIALSSYQS